MQFSEDSHSFKGIQQTSTWDRKLERNEYIVLHDSSEAQYTSTLKVTKAGKQKLAVQRPL